MKTEKKPASYGTLFRMIALVGIIVVVVLGVQWIADNMWAAIPIAAAAGFIGGAAYFSPDFRAKLVNGSRTAYRFISGKPGRIKTDQH